MSAQPPILGPYGVFVFGPPTPTEAAEIERLGYRTLWIGGSPDPELAFAEPLLAATESLTLATGVVNIWSAPASHLAASFHRINTAHPGRFLAGVGAGHQEHTAEYTTPYQAVVRYLDELDSADVPVQQRILAALGPKMLRLAAARSAGAHPALTPPRYNVTARAELGSGPLLAPVQAVLLGADTLTARAAGRQFTDVYLGLRNYVANWRRLDYSQDDLTPPGSDRLVDDMLAYGSPAQVATRLGTHLDTGADHVAVQLLGNPDHLLPGLAQLAVALDL